MAFEASPMSTAVSQVNAAESAVALQHFEALLRFETDCWDVHESLQASPDFILIDVRSPALYAKGHIDGAINIPHGKLTEHGLSRYPQDTLFVVYCAGPHCNGAQRGAIRLAKLGRPVKIMIGGVTGWVDEGFELRAE
jgi:rhodanese-related sulfurtransferase